MRVRLLYRSTRLLNHTLRYLFPQIRWVWRILPNYDVGSSPQADHHVKAMHGEMRLSFTEGKLPLSSQLVSPMVALHFDTITMWQRCEWPKSAVRSAGPACSLHSSKELDFRGRCAIDPTATERKAWFKCPRAVGNFESSRCYGAFHSAITALWSNGHTA